MTLLRLDTYVSYKGSTAEGAVEINSNEIVVFKKSNAIRFAFGAIGSALSNGKEVLRFYTSDIESYSIRKSDLTINLYNGESFIISMRNGVKEYFLPMVQRAVGMNSMRNNQSQTNQSSVVQSHQTTYPVNPSVNQSKEAQPFKYQGPVTYTYAPDTQQSEKKFCRACGRQLLEDSVFCSYCGTKQISVCPNCGDQLIGGEKFCRKCGTRL